MVDGTPGVLLVRYYPGRMDNEGVVRLEDVQDVHVVDTTSELEPSAMTRGGVFGLVTLARAGHEQSFVWAAQYACAVLGVTIYSRIEDVAPSLRVGTDDVPLEAIDIGTHARSYRVPSRPSVARGDQVQVTCAQDGRTTTAVVYLEMQSTRESAPTEV
jgi:hypothetical protein